MTAPKILAISGSLRAASHNTQLLRAAQKFNPSRLDIELYEGLREIPPYDQDLDTPENRPAAVTDLRRQVAEAAGLLIATPEFNYSIPGVLKNALDWLSTDWTQNEGLPLHRKPVAILGAAPTNFGTVRAQLALRQVFVWINSDVVVKPEVHVFRSQERFDADGNLTDQVTIDLLQGLLTELQRKIDAAEGRS
ncbi:NADPH-dependent FMN reductase [Streptomyces sp. VRA16 Mangrove soil]|uniref:NADPH-dependent FMN reductase n=1 Tax=Streptomyces sp. VRA16 Mangrove soil TaxID=2817434 RepID=UPI001A9E14E9|nr:NADPH-dependent FMN reductase [Streptomyces sp. VRA16 Mangrove soil]MBO1331369.1 NAD(P)H-dependent oxidoreductase [Streptomyces sp. VRA16 Mangrove soil]